MNLLVDDRERHVIAHLSKYSTKMKINFNIKRLITSDYAIMYKGVLIAIIERKTWEDLAASIRDGRKDNVKKLLDVREETGCQIYYLIEGDASPPSNKKYSRFPAKYMKSHLDHLAYRDGIHMVYSKNAEYTAYRLFELIQNLSTIKNPSITQQIDELIAKEEKKSGGTETKMFSEEKSLTRKRPKQINTSHQLLRQLPNIGSVLCSLLAEKGVTLSSIYKGQHTEDEIASLKYQSGMMIGLKKARLIIRSKNYLTGTSLKASRIQNNILATIPGVSKGTAKKILAEVTFADLIDGTATYNKVKNIKRGKTTLGNVVTNNILTYLRGQNFDNISISSSPIEPVNEVEDEEANNITLEELILASDE